MTTSSLKKNRTLLQLLHYSAIALIIGIIILFGVRIYGQRSYLSQADRSDAAAYATLTVTSPNGGNTWRAGSTYNVTWNYTPPTPDAVTYPVATTVCITASSGNLRQNVSCVSGATTRPGSNSYALTVPSSIPKGSGYRINVQMSALEPTSTGGYAYPKDESDNTFTISPAGITYISPGQSISNAIKALSAGDTLYLRGGTYIENVSASKANVTIASAPGEKAIIQGLFWMSNSSNTTFKDLYITWNNSNTSTQHMVKFDGGTGWKFINSEVWGAKSYAGVQVSGGTSGWLISNVYVHDTYKSNSTNQDHLIYVNNSTGGTIERCLLVNSVNGRGVKLGPPSGSGGPSNIVIRYNTFYNNLGPANIQFSYGTSNSTAYRNIFQKSGSGNPNVSAYNLTGAGNSIHDNVGWESNGKVADSIFNTGGNLYINPQFTNISGGNFRPLNTAASGYGKYAP